MDADRWERACTCLAPAVGDPSRWASDTVGPGGPRDGLAAPDVVAPRCLACGTPWRKIEALSLVPERT
jgi:hypothetical protein